MKTWVYDPHSGGVNIPPAVRTRTEQRILKYAEKHYAGKYVRLGIRFRGALCYIDAYNEPQEPSPELLRITGESREQFLERLRDMPTHLCRLRYFGNEEKWSLAFYTYSNERYERPCFITELLKALPRKGSKPGRPISERGELDTAASNQVA